MSAMTDTIKSKFGAVARPIATFGDVSLKSLEKLTSMQLDSARFYASLNIDQLREALGAKDIKSAKNFAAGRISYLSTINKRMTEDYKGVMALREESKEEIMAAFKPAAKPAIKKTAAKTTSKKPAAPKKPRAAAKPVEAPISEEATPARDS